MQGRCACGAYSVTCARAPLIVHACHCTRCRRETGSAFALNALVEAASLVTRGDEAVSELPTDRGEPQIVRRCAACGTAVWSCYPGFGPKIAFLRVGALDEPMPPDVHIWTRSKLPWVPIPEGARQVGEFYRLREVWTEEAVERLKATREG